MPPGVAKWARAQLSPLTLFVYVRCEPEPRSPTVRRILPVLLLAACVSDTDGGQVARTSSPHGLAPYMCQVFMKQALKSPSTSSFVADAGGAEQVDSVTWRAWGAVDAQNSFGAVLRSDFECRMRYEAANDRWELLSLTPGE